MQRRLVGSSSITCCALHRSTIFFRCDTFMVEISFQHCVKLSAISPPSRLNTLVQLRESEINSQLGVGIIQLDLDLTCEGREDGSSHSTW
jgi:hypothetical protein